MAIFDYQENMQKIKGLSDKELAKELRHYADGAYISEHRPAPCTICELGRLAEEAARRLEQS